MLRVGLLFAGFLGYAAVNLGRHGNSGHFTGWFRHWFFHDVGSYEIVVFLCSGS